jgi:hypothetical protein
MYNINRQKPFRGSFQRNEIRNQYAAQVTQLGEILDPPEISLEYLIGFFETDGSFQITFKARRGETTGGGETLSPPKSL